VCAYALRGTIVSRGGDGATKCACRLLGEMCVSVGVRVCLGVCLCVPVVGVVGVYADRCRGIRDGRADGDEYIRARVCVGLPDVCADTGSSSANSAAANAGSGILEGLDRCMCARGGVGVGVGVSVSGSVVVCVCAGCMCACVCCVGRRMNFCGDGDDTLPVEDGGESVCSYNSSCSSSSSPFLLRRVFAVVVGVVVGDAGWRRSCWISLSVCVNA
jgi:hypothetical protein